MSSGAVTVTAGSIPAGTVSASAILFNRTIGMDGVSRYLILAAVITVFLVLLAGLWNMLRGTSPNLSQTLMRWRVGLQFLAIVIMMVLLYLWGS